MWKNSPIHKFLVFFKGLGTYKRMQNRAGMEDLSLNPQSSGRAGNTGICNPTLRGGAETGKKKTQNCHTCSTSICSSKQQRPCLEQGGRQGRIPEVVLQSPRVPHGMFMAARTHTHTHSCTHIIHSHNFKVCKIELFLFRHFLGLLQV